MLRGLLIIFLTSASLHAETYCFGFLNAHPERKEIPQAEAMEIQKGHLAHMEKMGQEGHLLAAGPIVTPGGPRGVLIYRCKSLDEVREWTSGDPAVQNKRLTLDMWRWQGPDGIGEPLMSRLKADPKAKYEMVRLPLIVFRRSEKSGAAVIAWTGSIATKNVRATGPFVDVQNPPKPGDALSVLIFSAMPLEEATSLAEQHPWVQQGYARVDAYLWMVADDVIPKVQVR